MREWLYGRNAVLETLRSRKRSFFRLLVSQGVQEKGTLEEILRIVGKMRLPVEHIPRQRLDVIAEGHQGVALEASQYSYSTLMDQLAVSEQRKEAPFFLVLDVIQDPQNLGSLLRTAEAVGVHGVILPLRQAATITPAVVNASAGACEHLLIGQANLAQAIEQLKLKNIWVVGLEDTPDALAPSELRLDGGLALVVGSEGQGMRRLVRESCDVLLRLPMRGRINSLNAAVAGSIALWLARGEKLRGL